MAGKSGTYEETILKERQEREERFKNSERGWLGLVGLYWLRDGESRIGSAPDNDIILPANVPEHIGSVLYNNGVATFRATRGVPVHCNGKQVTLKTLVPDIQREAGFSADRRPDTGAPGSRRAAPDTRLGQEQRAAQGLYRVQPISCQPRILHRSPIH
jgi:hypothetical protein